MKLKSVVSLRNPTPVRDDALEVFHNLPSDTESDESSLSEAEDVMTAKSFSSENTDIDEEKDDIRHQKFPEKRFASNSYSGPMKLKFRKHTVSEKDRLKNVLHIPTKCKSRRYPYCYTRPKQNEIKMNSV
ncbi:hypothetical protein TNIN_92891 [Trichonephila inaurata madagascariensis]|uniref:Uncharacterized protein n=1 Tax=Trichonephila inaurata madagascariensis TaxID=2747483 RepID=A0A8X7CB13_9ARAC|nr:hypothetical protein TNIN_92891 [Trichonephila inaurata madagascariensis]